MSVDTPFFDDLETRERQQRESAQFEQLRAQLKNAKANAPALAKLYAEIDPDSINSREDLAKLPLIRKSELMDLQAESKPFGGLVTQPYGSVQRVFSSPGPIYEPEGNCKDYWRMGRALYAAGVRSGDLLYNTFSYHFTPAGSMLESGAHAIGCAVFPAGIGQTEQQLEAIANLKPEVYVGTPSFLKILLEKAEQAGVDASGFKKALVSGEALPGSLREELQAKGVAVLQCYATADLGLIAYETPAMEGMVIDEHVLVEIVRPGTGDPVAVGEVGEVVVTTLRNTHYPLIRFATGDMSKLIEAPSPCGRSNWRIAGWMGRADQTTKVKGMFVHPSQVAKVVARHPEITKARLVVTYVDNMDTMTLHVESGAQDDTLASAIKDSVREMTKLRGDVCWAAPGSLPNDGKVIDDQRNYD